MLFQLLNIDATDFTSDLQTNNLARRKDYRYQISHREDFIAVKHMAEILIVDDNREHLEMLKLLFRCEGIEVHLASSGIEALKMMTEKTFSLMITDLNMPGMDGLELSRKALLTAPYMTIVMCTGELNPEIQHLATEIGIMTVLGKPFNSKRILQIVMDVVEQPKI